MDCEKLESLIIDELYGELDEVTSAAVKRHVSGCARCAAKLSGLKATRRVAVLEAVEPPDDLEERILAAARDAQKVVPIGRRVSRIVAWAGSWSMRPQTASAALFLVMIGIGALLLRGKPKSSSSAIHVSEEGAPAASAVTETIARPNDLESADNAHGAGEAKALAPSTPAAAPVATAAASAAPAPEFASKDEPAPNAYYDGLSKGGGGGSAPPPPMAKKSARAGSGSYGGSLGGDPMNTVAQGALSGAANGPGGYEQRQAPASNAAPHPMATPQAPVAQVAGQGRQPSADDQGKRDRDSSDFDVAMAAYNAGDYPTATQLFDTIAAGGDLTAALWAARSVRAGNGTCAQAVPRFEDVATRGAGTSAGWQAQLEAGRCYRLLGQTEAARARLGPLLIVPSVAKAAQNELALLSQQGGASASRKAAAAPSPAPAKPAPPQKPAAADAY